MTILPIIASVAIEFYGPCSSKPLFTGQLPAQFESVGDLTIHFLDKNRIPYQGTEQGLNSVASSPTGMAAMEVISDVELRSYGWCYFVDGKVPEVFPNDYSLKNVKKIQWIFSYAHFKNGVWSGQCSKAFEIKPPFLCH